MKTVEVTLIIEVPNDATEHDVKSWVDVELCGWNSMREDNPCIEGAEVIDSDIRH